MQVPVAHVRIQAGAAGRARSALRRTMRVPAERKGARPVGEAGGEVERNIEALLTEDRVFEPPPGFRETAVAADPGVYDEANRRPRGLLGRAGRATDLDPPMGHRDGVEPAVGELVRRAGNSTRPCNCLDRHVEAGGGDKVAFYWEGEPGDTRTHHVPGPLRGDLPVRQRPAERSASRKGDRVAIYLGMVPELPVAMLACARIGAAHSVVFGGFSAEALKDRINDAEAKVLITADGGYRRGQIVPAEGHADAAVAECPSIEHVVTVRRTRRRASLHGGTRPLVPRAGRRSVHRVPARADGRRGLPLPPVHERHHRASPRGSRTRPAAT